MVALSSFNKSKNDYLNTKCISIIISHLHHDFLPYIFSLWVAHAILNLAQQYYMQQ